MSSSTVLPARLVPPGIVELPEVEIVVVALGAADELFELVHAASPSPAVTITAVTCTVRRRLAQDVLILLAMTRHPSCADHSDPAANVYVHIAGRAGGGSSVRRTRLRLAWELGTLTVLVSPRTRGPAADPDPLIR